MIPDVQPPELWGKYSCLEASKFMNFVIVAWMDCGIGVLVKERKLTGYGREQSVCFQDPGGLAYLHSLPLQSS